MENVISDVENIFKSNYNILIVSLIYHTEIGVIHLSYVSLDLR